MRERNENQMKGRWTRLNENANKWVAAYKESYRQKRSGMSMTDVEKGAHAIYEGGRKKFLDLLVFNQVMCKHPKWEIKLDCDTTRSRTEYEMGCEDSGRSTKRSKTTEEEDTDQESPIVGRSTIQRPTGRDVAKKRGKGKTSQSSSFSNDFSTELHAMTITRNNKAELLTKKLNFDKEKFDVHQHHKNLRILIAKEHLSPAEEALKERLFTMLYG
ncbi:uncharacterized protein LOC112529039 [Cynara cardunculus var. scolymus]|uniref:uncharacterized protein LOC112529039 n=1 Tax=Cynara cardunculus var. scolymus TaxID=59895 RepID=UPI000D62F34D|nr:uncharacterized protein LOC112529039 [Cynara cardunculus var. scolymus]